MSGDLVVLGAAFLLCGLLARAGGRIGLPTIPLFIAAGIAMGPYTPGPVLFAHPEDLALLATFGLVFLLFSLGIEFSLEEMVSGGRRLLIASGVYLALNIGGGLAFGFALGWGSREAFVVAGATGISSSAIVTKVLVELRRLGRPESRLILGIIVIEDLFLALYLAALAPILGQADGAADALLLFGRAFAFLLVLTAVARWGTPWVERLVVSRDDELLVIAFVGLALLVAGAAHGLGLSDAIGAFMAGLVLSASSARRRIERLVHPLRDTFAAIFFFAFGLSIDPSDAGQVVAPAAAAIVMSLLLALAAAVVAGRLHGFDRLAVANIATTVLARGEFAIILVALAAAANLDERVAPFVALYVLVLAIASPVLAKRSDLVARLLPGALVGAPPGAPSAPQTRP